MVDGDKVRKKGRMSSILSRLHSLRNIIALWRRGGEEGRRGGGEVGGGEEGRREEGRWERRRREVGEEVEGRRGGRERGMTPVNYTM